MAERELGDEDAGGRALSATDKAVRAKGRRKRAAQHYAQAAEYRALAAEDRHAAAQDREQAARDRARAASEPTTGARAHAADLSDVERELSRCRRTNDRLVVACVAIVLDDSRAHDLSDELLERVTAFVTSQLRTYDVVIRLGADQLVCAMSGMTLAAARERFSAIAAAISDASNEVSIDTGFGDVAAYETATALIARAEQALVASRDAINAPHFAACGRNGLLVPLLTSAAKTASRSTRAPTQGPGDREATLHDRGRPQPPAER